jgi:hypothetical protein
MDQTWWLMNVSIQTFQLSACYFRSVMLRRQSYPSRHNDEC